MQTGFPIGLAPMAGYTGRAFRLLCRAQGADFAVTEMISAKGLVYGAAATRALLLTCGEDAPLGVQLFGREPETVAAAACICAETLGGGLAAIDLNMGCPAPKITGNGEGSALMKEPALAGRIVAAAAKRAGVPVTVKFRSGWDETCVNAVEFARICEENGAAALTLHARTRAQMYGGRADWALIARVKAAVRIPVIGNGDIRSGADALRMRDETGCDAASIGRAALGNPWIFAEAAAARGHAPYSPPTETEIRQTALLHARMELAQKGAHAIVELRKHIAWYIRGVPGASELRMRVNEAKNYGELEQILT